MCETLFHPVCQSLPFAANQGGTERQSDDHPKKQETAVAKTIVVLGVRKGPSRTRQEDAQGHEDGKGPDVEYALDCPNGTLEGNGQFMPSGDQIGANEFPRPA